MMKTKVCIGLSAMLLLGTLNGCGQTQSVETTVPTQAAVTYSAPDRFIGDWTGLNGVFTVHADAPIELPDLDHLCTATLERRQFTQEEADKILEVFLKGNTLYKEPVATKQELQERVEHYEAIQRGEIPYDHDGTIDRVPGILADLKEQIKVAPNEGERFEEDTRFHPLEQPRGVTGHDDYSVITGCAEVDGKQYHVSIQNDDVHWYPFAKVWRDDLYNSIGPGLLDVDWSQDAIDGTSSFTREQAQEMGDALIAGLGCTSFTLDHIEPDGTGFVLVYVRNVNGLPLRMTNYIGQSSDEVNPAPGVFPYERIHMVLGRDGIQWFEWSGPYTEPEIQEKPAELMPFDQIQEIFGKMIFVKNTFWEDVHRANQNVDFHEIQVDRVQLGLMRVKDAHTLGPATIVPVWDFWGTEAAFEDEQAYQKNQVFFKEYGVVMTINAIDGTMIDRELGY